MYENPLQNNPLYSGLKIIISDYVKDEKLVPVKKHRRKRIQKKWIKRYGMKTVKCNNLYKMGNNVICSQDTFDRMFPSEKSDE